MLAYRPEQCRTGPDKQFVPSDLIYIDWKLVRVLDKKTDLTGENLSRLKNKITDRQTQE